MKIINSYIVAMGIDLDVPGMLNGTRKTLKIKSPCVLHETDEGKFYLTGAILYLDFPAIAAGKMLPAFPITKELTPEEAGAILEQIKKLQEPKTDENGAKTE